jgi:hypothetical protein
MPIILALVGTATDGLPQVMSLWRWKRSADGQAQDRLAPFALQ